MRRPAFRLATLTAVSIALRSYAPMVAVALALAAGGCGDSDGSGGSGGSDGTSAGGTDRQQVRSTVEGLYEDLADYDAEAVCERMSPAARRQIAQGAIGGASKPDATCADAFGEFLDQAKANGGLKRTLSAKVGKVEIDGRKALVTVSFGAQAGQIPLRKVGGEWKMGIVVATPSTEPPAASKR